MQETALEVQLLEQQVLTSAREHAWRMKAMEQRKLELQRLSNEKSMLLEGKLKVLFLCEILGFFSLGSNPK